MNEKGPPHLPDEIPKISEPQRLFAGGSRPGHTDTISVSQTAPIANIDALVLIASESDVPRSNEIARRVSVSVPNAHVCSFGPRIRSDLGAIMANEFLRVVAVPLSTSAEDPLLSDLTGLVRRAATRWKNTHFLLSAPIGKTQHVVGWASRQAQIALCSLPRAAPPEETALLVVGAGGNIPARNAEVCAIARLLWENRDYGLVEAAFAQDARPTVAEGIDRLIRLGAGLIVVLPLTLFEGSIYRAVDRQVESADVPRVLLARPLLSATGVAAVARQRYEDALTRWFGGGGDGLLLDHGHNHGFSVDPLRAGDALLPPRYRGGQKVSFAAMRSAPLKYDAEGRVAWDEVWQSFCDLALAGGPPHRGTLLEPALIEEVREDPDGYERVVAEITRGLALVTNLPVITDAAPGWVGLVCRDDETAVWLLRAIIVENISVRREGATLFLPAGPAYRVEKEIKNVITAIAKTYHYWTEHRAAR